MATEHLPKKDSKPDSNWVEKAGGLPSYIEEIAVHLHKGHGDVGRAIAEAVNTVRRWAAGGTVRKNGGGKVKPDTQAKAAKAIAEWESKKAASHVNAGIETDDEFILNLSMQADLADEDEFDMGLYELSLGQERKARGIPQSLDMAIPFDPSDHPRDWRGKFRSLVAGLTEGDSVELPTGTTVTAKTHTPGHATGTDIPVLEVTGGVGGGEVRFPVAEDFRGDDTEMHEAAVDEAVDAAFDFEEAGREQQIDDSFGDGDPLDHIVAGDAEPHIADPVLTNDADALRRMSDSQLLAHKSDMGYRIGATSPGSRTANASEHSGFQQSYRDVQDEVDRRRKPVRNLTDDQRNQIIGGMNPEDRDQALKLMAESSQSSSEQLDLLLAAALRRGAGEQDSFEFSQILDEGRFQLALNQERSGRKLALAINFDPQMHPRDLRGKFRAAVKDLKTGESIKLPDGTTVKSLDSGYKIGDSKVTSAREAADKALDKSAQSTDPKSVGGGRKHKGIGHLISEQDATDNTGKGEGPKSAKQGSDLDPRVTPHALDKDGDKADEDKPLPVNAEADQEDPWEGVGGEVEGDPDLKSADEDKLADSEELLNEDATEAAVTNAMQRMKDGDWLNVNGAIVMKGEDTPGGYGISVWDEDEGKVPVTKGTDEGGVLSQLADEGFIEDESTDYESPADVETALKDAPEADRATPQGFAYELNKAVDAAEGDPDAVFDNVAEVLEESDNIPGVTPIEAGFGAVVDDRIVTLSPVDGGDNYEMRPLEESEQKSWAEDAISDIKNLIADLKSDEDGAKARYKAQLKALKQFL